MNKSTFGRRQRMAVATRLVIVAFALICLGVAFFALLSVSMAGFPDGYISPYAQLTNPAVQVLAGLIVLSAVYFLLLAWRGRRMAPAAALLQMVAAATLTFAPLAAIQTCPRWGICGQAYQDITGSVIDDGQGG